MASSVTYREVESVSYRLSPAVGCAAAQLASDARTAGRASDSKSQTLARLVSKSDFDCQVGLGLLLEPFKSSFWWVLSRADIAPVGEA